MTVLILEYTLITVTQFAKPDQLNTVILRFSAVIIVLIVFTVWEWVLVRSALDVAVYAINNIAFSISNTLKKNDTKKWTKSSHRWKKTEPYDSSSPQQ
jgi:hypothetical protein